VCLLLFGVVAGGLPTARSAWAAGTGSIEEAVIGGDSTEPGEYPATGALVHGQSFRCTATLIAPDVALTAAHCLNDEGFGDLAFTLDTDLTDEFDGLIPVTAWHRHPDFQEHGEGDELTRMGRRNDLGVMILERPIEDVPFEQFEATEEIAFQGGRPELTVVGYGLTRWSEASTAGVKRDGVVLLDRSSTWELLSMNMDPQPCRGDSGGPLFVETARGRRITGLVSRGFGVSNQCDSGAIFTRVAPYADWIANASIDAEVGCSAGGGRGAVWPVLLAWLTLALRRRR